MKKLFLIMLIGFVTLSFAQSVLLNDVDVAVKLARIEQKKLAIVFTTQTCPYCVKLKNETLTDKTVKQLIMANYIFAEAMYDAKKVTSAFGEKKSYAQLFDYFGISGVPTTWFFSSEASPLVYLPGYAPASTFAQVLRYVYQEIKEDFSLYAKKKDDFTGEKKLLKVTRQDADFVLSNDPNSLFVDHVPEKPDIFKVHITESEQIALKLIDRGVYRVLLITD
ncbi:thioredoxin fold domain-containing protein [Pseudothermotoga sp.]|uniref:thioredoxin family protein n=1 Tax=Pseudothermotoga sp. TaxID=2033661 RepID=UPI0031F67E61